MPRWTVGLIFTKKKIERSGLIGIEDYAMQHDMQVVQLDISSPLESQGPVDMIVHKMTDIVGKMNRGDTEARTEYERFTTYCKDHPHVLVLDRWEDIEKVLDRVDLFDHLAPYCQNPLFKIPPYHALTSIQSIAQLADDLSFPVICKRRSACSSTEAHQMTLIPTRHHLKDIHGYDANEELVVQNFIQHDGVLVKVYVINGEISVSTRPSFMNVTKDTDMVYFDSQKIPKQFEPTTELQQCYGSGAMQKKKEDVLDHDRLRQISRALKEHLGLTFFGFDVLLESGTDNYYVVDVNYFPSFKNVPHFQSVFIDVLQNKLVRHSPL